MSALQAVRDMSRRVIRADAAFRLEMRFGEIRLEGPIAAAHDHVRCRWMYSNRLEYDESLYKKLEDDFEAVSVRTKSACFLILDEDPRDTEMTHED